MGTFNRLKCEWICPVCGRTQTGEIQFKYGACYQHLYKLGDKLDWERGIVYEERLVNGSGLVEGLTFCSNGWDLQWRSANELHGSPQRYPPKEERKKWGCPETIHVRLEIENDVIKRLILLDAEEQWRGEFDKVNGRGDR